VGLEGYKTRQPTAVSEIPQIVLVCNEDLLTLLFKMNVVSTTLTQTSLLACICDHSFVTKCKLHFCFFSMFDKK
jgi:hypothetical protein